MNSLTLSLTRLAGKTGVGAAGVIPLLILMAAFFHPTAFGQSPKIAQTEVRLEPAAPSPTAHDQFGNVTALSANGQTLAIGATTTDQGAISEDGAVLIFDLIQDEWVHTARLFPSDGTDDEQSAFNVAISEDGNTVLSIPLAHSGVFVEQGAIYVFHRVNGSWTQQAELLSPTPSRDATFGTFGIGISGDTIAAVHAGEWRVAGLRHHPVAQRSGLLSCQHCPQRGNSGGGVAHVGRNARRHGPRVQPDKRKLGAPKQAGPTRPDLWVQFRFDSGGRWKPGGCGSALWTRRERVFRSRVRIRQAR
jgi:hypothetical protein